MVRGGCIAAAFAAEFDPDDEPGTQRPGALYLLHRSRLEAHGFQVFDRSTRAPRPHKQQALSLYLQPGTDLRGRVVRITFNSSCHERSQFLRPDLLDAHNDPVATEVARLTYCVTTSDIGRVVTSTTDSSRTIATSKVDVDRCSGLKSIASAARYCQCHDELRNFLRHRSQMRQHVPAATRRWQHMRKAAIALRLLATA